MLRILAVWSPPATSRVQRPPKRHYHKWIPGLRLFHHFAGVLIKLFSGLLTPEIKELMQEFFRSQYV
jgi:hypothetical protein